jgi:hypothetical protein
LLLGARKALGNILGGFLLVVVPFWIAFGRALRRLVSLCKASPAYGSWPYSPLLCGKLERSRRKGSGFADAGGASSDVDNLILEGFYSWLNVAIFRQSEWWRLRQHADAKCCAKKRDKSDEGETKYFHRAFGKSEL